MKDFGSPPIEKVKKLSIDKHEWTQKWLAGIWKIPLHFTPKYSSWLNQVEIWFNILTKDVIKNGICRCTELLTSQLKEYVKANNSTLAKPFHCTYTETNTLKAYPKYRQKS